MTNFLANVLGGLDGAVIPGGCDDCDAYQTVTVLKPSMWSVVIHHDDDCPTWERLRELQP